jgi:hypothetical protein
VGEFDDLDKPGFLTEAVYVTAGPTALYGARRFAVVCGDCGGYFGGRYTEEEAYAAEAVHIATCPKRGRTLRYVT